MTDMHIFTDDDQLPQTAVHVASAFFCALSMSRRVHRYLGQWIEALAAYRSALATVTQAHATGVIAGDVESSCDETLRIISNACESAERSIYRQPGVRLKPSSTIPEYDLGPAFPALKLDRRRKPLTNVQYTPRTFLTKYRVRLLSTIQHLMTHGLSRVDSELRSINLIRRL